MVTSHCPNASKVLVQLNQRLLYRCSYQFSAGWTQRSNQKLTWPGLGYKSQTFDVTANCSLLSLVWSFVLFSLPHAVRPHQGGLINDYTLSKELHTLSGPELSLKLSTEMTPVDFWKDLAAFVPQTLLPLRCLQRRDLQGNASSEAVQCEL
ncbi:hypothetical protein PoB_002583900 [Plakobranchus ocellatus]|uniref:Uncharacterized protein n=1 Tax=Plakobranchus ocellatus TaxID=259542 RepID=A0AAV3ZY66_9GAST|nr:hypothetical protein PoB_002583900 [Plakobranchus ocellatus]